jgi:HD superfamily phosphohydrolase
VNSVGTLHDRLYGGIPYTADDLRLWQTPELTRLRDISLSSVPPPFMRTGQSDSRFQHSVGVAYLAQLVGEKKEFAEMARDLYFTALVHDIGHPPFSHICEHFQRRVLGRDHEAETLAMLETKNSSLAAELRRQGACLKTIKRLLTKEAKPWCGLINGCVDLDNIDNSLRYGISTGILARKAGYYSPALLTRGFTLYQEPGVTAFKLGIESQVSSHLLNWERCRMLVYDYVYSPDNLVVGAMIYRALDFACRAGQLTPWFFQLTDAAALQYLERRCNRRVQYLIRALQRWQFYTCVFHLKIDEPPPKVKTVLDDLETRTLLATEVSKEFALQPEEVLVYAGKSRRARAIQLKVVTDLKAEEFKGLQVKPQWFFHVYVNPYRSDVHERVAQYVATWLKQFI